MLVINTKPEALRNIEKDNLSLIKKRAAKTEIITPINRASKLLFLKYDFTIKNSSVKKNISKAI